MLTEAHENAIYSWLYGQLGINVVWKSQNAYERPHPLCVVGVIAGPVREGSTDSQTHTADDTSDTGEEVTITIRGPRLYSLSLDFLTSSDIGGENANYYAALVEQSLEKPSVRLALNQAGIAFVDILSVTDLDEVSAQKWISRCKMDIRIRVTAETTDDATFIDSVDFSGTIGDHTVETTVNEVTYMSSYGELILGTPAATTIATPGVYVDVAGTFAIDDQKDFVLSGTNGLKYIGEETKRFSVVVVGQGEVDTASKVHLRLAVEGSVDANSQQTIEFGAINTEQQFTIVAIVSLSENDVLDLMVTADDAMDFTANKCVLTALAA